MRNRPGLVAGAGRRTLLPRYRGLFVPRGGVIGLNPCAAAGGALASSCASWTLSGPIFRNARTSKRTPIGQMAIPIWVPIRAVATPPVVELAAWEMSPSIEPKVRTMPVSVASSPHTGRRRVPLRAQEPLSSGGGIGRWQRGQELGAATAYAWSGFLCSGSSYQARARPRAGWSRQPEDWGRRAVPPRSPETAG